MGREFGDMWGKFGENLYKNLGLLWGLSFLYLGREFKHNNLQLGFRFVGLNRLPHFNLNFNFNIDFRNER